MPLEKGIGPIHFNTSHVPECDGLNDLSMFENDFVKTERVILALTFLALLIITIYNIYSYLWKGMMYQSYPLVFTYIVLVLFSVLGFIYEIYMGFRCGSTDCFTHLLVSIMPEYQIYFAEEKHKNYLRDISIFWKLR